MTCYFFSRRLLPALQRAQGARVVSVSAWAHSRAPIVFEDPMFERREYSPWMAYGQFEDARERLNKF